MSFTPSPRLAVTAVFATFGVWVGLWVGSIPTVARQAGADSALLGMAFALSTVAIVATFSTGARLAKRMPGRTMMLWALAASGIAMPLQILSQSPAMLVACAMLASFCMGLLDVSMNTEASAIEREFRRPVFSVFHGTLSLTMALTAVPASMLANRYGLWPAAAIAAVLFVPAWILVWLGTPARALAAPPASAAPLANGRTLALLGLAAGASMAVEMSAMTWSAKMLDELAPSLAAVSGLGAAFFGLCGSAVRLPGDRLRARFGDVPLLLASFIVAGTACAMLGFASSFAQSAAAFAFIGLGSGIAVPCIFAMAARAVPHNGAAGISRVATYSALPRIVVPWLFGLVANVSGIGFAFGCSTIMLAVAFLAIWSLRPPTANSEVFT